MLKGLTISKGITMTNSATKPYSENDTINKVLNFMDFFMVSRPGFYDVDDVSLKKALIEFLEHGTIKQLEAQESIMYSLWNCNDSSRFYKQEEIDQILEAIQDHRDNNIQHFTDDELLTVEQHIQRQQHKTNEYNSYKSKRKLADSFIARPMIRKIVLKRSNNMCEECKSPDDLTIDHIISVKNGGLNELQNLRTLCRTCNSKKGAK